jgi:TetR/AcrR family transcriptional regulator, regulator of cefoperazone and chloramphenicol sensitivity
VTDERVRLCGFSVVSQCVFYHHCRPIVSRLFPKQEKPDAAGIERLADHITNFSLAAMKRPPAKKH